MSNICKDSVRVKVIDEMLGGLGDSGGIWKILILDEFTTRILSSSMRMSDIMDANISVVEDLYKRREPLSQPAVYFIQPTSHSINRLIDDFSGKQALYQSVHVFLSSKASNDAINKLKGCEKLMRVIKTLKEVNLEFLSVDSRTIITDHPHSFITAFSTRSEEEKSILSKELDSIAVRICTAFVTFGDVPIIRYRIPSSVNGFGEDDPTAPPGNNLRRQLTRMLATRIQDRISSMQRQKQLPVEETCDLLILDRSYDIVAPFIHEWSYESMTYDLLDLETDVYKYSSETASGKVDQKEAILDERDALWVDLRHKFIADVYTSLARRFKEFQSKNKAAKLSGNLKSKDMSAVNIRSLIQALPQYREVIANLSAHVQLSNDLRAVTSERDLSDLGELEQDLVLGLKNSREMLEYFADHGNVQPGDKMRLLLCYLATHPARLDATKKLQWQKAAGLTATDMAAVMNLACLNIRIIEPMAVAESGNGGKSSFFRRGGGSDKSPKALKATRTKRRAPDAGPEDEEDEYALDRFRPLLMDVVEQAAADRLPEDEFPYLNRPESTPSEPAARSARSARTGRGLNWNRREAGSNDSGRKLVVFILGGATRSEMKCVHELTALLGREVILISTAVSTPNVFLDQLYSLNSDSME
uniref:Uncharacterized protein n=2 Tax=Polytomella parva TaxID=51329 RepID=A0A7S0UQ57_9CHLO|mmetsp:Transcript_12417/g.22223  ORF Transcript_12417/g.22223 Transcript_12417/m.22223 type:complete len:645 (+) Transcript_12417:144-2078(+)